MANDPTRPRMPFVAALEVLLPLREERIVVTTMGAAREWPKLSRHPLDLHYIPSAMGAAPRWAWDWRSPSQSARCWCSTATAPC